MPPGRAHAVRNVYGLRCGMVESQEEGGVRVRGRVRGAARGTLALGQHTSPRAQKRELTSVKARAQESDGRAMDVGSGVRSRREMHAPRRGQCVVTHLKTHPRFRCRTARARMRARTLGTCFHSARLIHPKYCSDHGGNFRRMVFGLVPGPGLKGSTLFFPLDLYFFRGEQAGGEKIRRQLLPALGCASPSSAARKEDTYNLRATGSVGGHF